MVEKKNKKPKTKRVSKKLKISDIKRGEGATLTHLLHRIKSKEVELTAGCVVLCLVIILTSLYFVFSAVQKPSDYNTMKVGNFSISFNDIGDSLGNIVNLTPINPMSDLDGVKSEAYEIEIKNNSSSKQSFQIQLRKDRAMIIEDDCGDYQLDSRYLRYQINDGEIQSVDGAKKAPILFSYFLKAKEKRIVKIRIWVAQTLPTEYLQYHYHGKLMVKSLKDLD